MTTTTSPSIGPGAVRFRPMGDSAVLVDAPTLSGEDAWWWVHALDRALSGLETIEETSPALVNLLVRFDPMHTDHEAIAECVRTVLPVAPAPFDAVSHVLDVRYGGDDGSDLAAVAEATGLDMADVVARHRHTDFVVRMYGFAPGYAYLGGLPAELQLPRKPVAVRDVPAGSVLIANDQCLVSTITMPTGWWVIGRCDTPVLTPEAESPARFAVGDRVRFRPVEPSAGPGRVR